MRFAFIMDPIQHVLIDKDTTFVFMLESQARGHEVHYLGMEDLFSKPGVVILEWSERFPLPSPWPEMRIRLEHMGGDSRRIKVL